MMETIKLEKSIKEIFENGKYIVPLYQRNYAWRKNEIEQLLQDVYESFKKNRNGNSNTLLPSTREDYNTIFTNIKKNYEKSLQASVLSSFFQGAMSYTEEVEKATTSNIENVLKTKSETGSDPTMYIEFVWEDAQTLYFEGEQYKVTNNKTEKTVTFTSLAIEVKNNNAFDEITIYVIDSSSSSSRVSNYKIHTLAHQEDLYKYMLTLEIKGTLGA